MILSFLTFIVYQVNFILASLQMVIAAYIVLTSSCIAGMVYALKGGQKLVPLVGGAAFKLSSSIFKLN